MPLSPQQKKDLEAEMQQYVGKPIGPPRIARDAVNEPMIRQWCDAMGDTNPIYLDPAQAKESCHGGIVAPPAMLPAWTMQGWEMAAGYDEPRNNEHRLNSANFQNSLKAAWRGPFLFPRRRVSGLLDSQ